MTSVHRFACAALTLVAAGCVNYDRAQEPTGSGEMWVTESLRRASVEQAIVVQRSLFAYHFIPDSADLNELGMHDLQVLAAHFVDHPGEMNVRRGAASEDLYHDRVERVAEALAGMGVARDAIRIVDGKPGGDGVSSARMIQIFERESAPSETSPTDGGSGSSESSSNRGNQ